MSEFTLFNPDGGRKMFFHGTGEDFDKFSGLLRNIAGHFTPCPDLAAQFAQDSADSMADGDAYDRNIYPDETAQGPMIVAVHLFIENPFDFRNKKHLKILEEAMPGRKFAGNGDYIDLEDFDVHNTLIALGFDSILQHEGDENTLNVAVFFPELIKSAFHRGEYDFSSPWFQKPSLYPVQKTPSALTP